MNTDPFEERLRSLRPGTMPDTLRERLADAPPVEARRRGKVVWAVFAATAAAAACVVVFLRPARPLATSGAPVLASTSSSRVTEVKPLSVITDEADRPWKFVQVNWVEEDTLVSAANPAAIHRQDNYATVVPVRVIFD